MLLCICAFVFVSVNEWSVIGAFMKLQSILVIFIVILFMYYREFPMAVLSTLVMFG